MAKQTPEQFKTNIFTFLKLITDAYKSPYQFKPFHQALRQPFDLYAW
jgi:hypothetical protein